MTIGDKNMKTLRESILSTTKAGKYALIEDWCNKYLQLDDGEVQKFLINNKGEIEDVGCLGFKIGKHTKYKITKFPGYIKFGEINGAFTIGDEINYMSEEQLPKIAHKYFITGDVHRLNKIKLKSKDGIDFYVNTNKDFKIDNLTIQVENSNNSAFGPEINFMDTPLKYDDLKNINIIGNINTLWLAQTPAAKQLTRKINANLKKGISPDEFLKKEFQNFTGRIKFINMNKTVIMYTEENKWVMY